VQRAHGYARVPHLHCRGSPAGSTRLMRVLNGALWPETGSHDSHQIRISRRPADLAPAGTTVLRRYRRRPRRRESTSAPSR